MTKTRKEVEGYQLWVVCDCGAFIRLYDDWDGKMVRVKDCCRKCGRMRGDGRVTAAQLEQTYEDSILFGFWHWDSNFVENQLINSKPLAKLKDFVKL